MVFFKDYLYISTTFTVRLCFSYNYAFSNIAAYVSTPPKFSSASFNLSYIYLIDLKNLQLFIGDICLRNIFVC